ncbi:VWA domain-containing protein [Lacipirellula parvula]|uniref:Long form Mg-chelase associated protein with vWA domain n=1 Tax=Lacipirellula parvula TaxID=2650471 RepID=A0A5K7XKM8_9BACT|nr:VWA domain-containing protein [Lacipirellula parvula]BBO35096.1 long form Mg-chelase associated protein with vWA domain [Lacipirellula parvula]
MANRQTLGGVIHAYQQYDPKRFPSPTQPPPDMTSAAFEHMLMYGQRRELTPEQLARAIKIDPSQISGLGPSIDALIAILKERRRKILERFETSRVSKAAERAVAEEAQQLKPPKNLRERFHSAVKNEQIRDLERLWYAAGNDQSAFARGLVSLIETLGDKYLVEQLAAKYDFTGRESLSVPQALQVKEELEKIDDLIKQLEEARETAQIGLIDMDALAEFTEPGDVDQLSALQQQIQDYLREMAEQQGLEQRGGSFQLTPKAYRIFQAKLLEKLFSELAPSRSGRHQNNVIGEGAVELQTTKQYEFGDSVANMDITSSFVNALIRKGPGTPVRLDQEDIEIHRTRNSPKCATCVLMDMSGSMRYDGQYINVKRMALALEGLIRGEYPGDYLQFIEMYSFAKPVPRGKLIELMPKPVTVHDPIVRLRADMSRDDVSEHQVPPHFTNIQHALSTARRMLSTQDTPNRQIVLITDGLPTAHFEQQMLYLLYPPDPRTEEATLREGQLCRREGITINMFLMPSWSQTEEDVRFAYRLAESTKGRVFFTAGRDLDRYVVWDYLSRRRDIVS